MTNSKFAAKWALVGLGLALFSFLFNYHLAPVSLPGYELLAGPAMLAVSFFSEETPFWPKLAIFLLGQYLIYFLILWLTKLFISLLKK